MIDWLGERNCPECGGEGYIDEYQEDEWYEDDDDETQPIDPPAEYEPTMVHDDSDYDDVINWEDGYNWDRWADYFPRDRRPLLFRLRGWLSRRRAQLRWLIGVYVLRRDPVDYIPF